MRPLPLNLWLALEDDVARHKAELAQAFDEARARLLPEPPGFRWASDSSSYLAIGFQYHTAVALVAGI